jgi:hypothetical protein
MPSYLYNAWFENPSASEDDQDREWIACITIEAETSDEAKRWGDTLAMERSSREGGDVFLRSDIEAPATIGSADWSAVPRIVAGQRVSDDVLGW